MEFSELESQLSEPRAQKELVGAREWQLSTIERLVALVVERSLQIEVVALGQEHSVEYASNRVSEAVPIQKNADALGIVLGNEHESIEVVVVAVLADSHLAYASTWLFGIDALDEIELPRTVTNVEYLIGLDQASFD